MEEKSKQARDWLVTEWSERLCLILESMVDRRPAIRQLPEGSRPDLPEQQTLIWRQTFAVLEHPAIWVCTGSSTYLDLGRRTLMAAGVATVGEPECRSTFLEILSQSMSALGAAISVNWNCSAKAGLGEETTDLPQDLTWSAIELDFQDAQLEPIWIGIPSAFVARLVSGPAPVEEHRHPNGTPAAEETAQEPSGSNGSKTFALLLNVALPVSVSFGRTLLPIKDILRLSSGSIIELDRAVNEPVEIIVNDCVIARGEVVVIEGNYGVRIQQIASRHDRLQTGSAANQLKPVLPAV